MPEGKFYLQNLLVYLIVLEKQLKLYLEIIILCFVYIYTFYKLLLFICNYDFFIR